MTIQEYKRCSEGLWDTTIPNIKFDSNGVSNYAKLFHKLEEEYPRGHYGLIQWNHILEQIKVSGKSKKYDSIIGVSGGTDSSYLLYLAKKEWNLNPLAVTFDNGWSSDIAVKNIKKITSQLNIDLYTYVVDYEEMKEIHKAYMRSGLPWIDLPTDLAIRNILYRTAYKEKIKYILIGHDFRSEGTQPNDWTHGDSKQLKYIIKKFSSIRLNSYPYLSLLKFFYLTYVQKIKILRPYYYIEYNKQEAQKYLIDNYSWEYYGGHHHENIFTKFTIAYWLKKKFNIDKRIITLSAQVLSGHFTRDSAIELLKEEPYDPLQMERDKNYVIKKLGLTDKEFDNIWNSANKTIFDYPSFLPFFNKYSKFVKPILSLILHSKPTFFYQHEMNQEMNSK
jgi:N-acetyl sugar amidotransferase